MRIFIAVLFFVIVTGNACSQDFKVMFYNVENFFDVMNNPDKDDDSFTPKGENHWNKERFLKKRNNIYKVIAAAGVTRMPDIIGLCEVENRYVLRQLTEQTPLAKYNYGIVHYDSPDRRGIDVALLYNRDSFEVIKSKALTVGEQTRDILYVKGCTVQKDTLHFFVNHWTSKWGGAASESGRILAAQVLKKAVDSIFHTNIKANICAMGDFNDYPDSNPIKLLETKTENAGSEYLYNLSLHLQENNEGSIKYAGRWELIDLFFVSGNLLFNDSGLNCSFDDISIFKPDFLLEAKTGEGNTPKRTYRGPVYVGGFSDHLPVILNFSRK